jgi:hypothetical protein
MIQGNADVLSGSNRVSLIAFRQCTHHSDRIDRAEMPEALEFNKAKQPCSCTSVILLSQTNTTQLKDHDG